MTDQEYSTIGARIDMLTPAEREIFELLALGMDSNEIAAQRGTTGATVKTQSKRILRKMRAHRIGGAINDLRLHESERLRRSVRSAMELCTQFPAGRFVAAVLADAL